MKPSSVVEDDRTTGCFEELVLQELSEVKALIAKDSIMLSGLQTQVAELCAASAEQSEELVDTVPTSFAEQKVQKVETVPRASAASALTASALMPRPRDSLTSNRNRSGSPQLSSQDAPINGNESCEHSETMDDGQVFREEGRRRTLDHSRKRDSSRMTFVRTHFNDYRRQVSWAGRMLEKERTMSRKESEEVKKTWRDRLRSFVNSAVFSYCIMGVIIFNLLFLGVEVEISLGVGSQDVPQVFATVNAIVVCIFVLEAALSMVAHGCKGYLCGKERWWNLFDLLIIAMSVAEMVKDLWAASSSQSGQVLFMRSLRFARALRGVRVMRLLRYVSALRTLVLSILSSMGSLLWTAVLLVLIFYSFAVILTQLVSDYCRAKTIEEGGDNNAIPIFSSQYVQWSSIPESMLTLFLSITGGLDQVTALDPLREVSPIAFASYLMYVSLTMFAIVNVVTGVFCNTAIESAQTDKEIAVMKQIQRQRIQVETLRGFFREMDDEETSVVSLKELQDAIHTGKLSGFLESMGISTQDVWTLFMIIDVDKSGLIGLDEFVSGCMQLHGPAKSLHLAKMSHENKVARQMLSHVERMLSGALSKLDQLLPGSSRASETKDSGWHL